MATEGYKRKLTTMLSADVAGYSRLMGDDEAATVKTLTAYRGIMADLIKQHRGRVVDSPGDNLLAEFSSVVDAVQCAVAVQKEFQARNAELPENRRMEFRIGINLGDVIEEEDRIYGDGVNIAARLESCADPGGICVSKTAFDQIESKLPLGYEFLGEQEVKNIAKPVGAYRVLMEPRVTVAGEKEKKPSVPVWRRKGVLAGALAALIVIIGAVVWNFHFRPPAIEPASKEKMAYPLPDKPSIAVLPFVNISGDPAQEYIADGICESIITALCKIPEMFVIARTSTATYKGKPVKIHQVSEELGVRYVLEGSVQKTGDRIRVTAQLIDAITGHHLWADRYDRDTEGFFDVLDEISKKVAIELQVKLTEGDAARMSQKTKNFEAWGCATSAYSLFRLPTKENIAKARELFEKAVKLDPEYAFAWGGMGATHYSDVYLGYTESRDKSFALAVECIDKSLKLDETLPCSTGVKARLYMLQKQFEQAIALGEKAIALAPSQDLPYFVLGFIMGYAGRFEEAIALIKQAMRLNPHYPSYYLTVVANNYFLAGRYEEALEAHKKAFEHYPKGGAPFVIHLGLSAAYIELGREEEARTHAAEVMKMNPKVSLENLRKGYYSYYKDPAHPERFLSSLRKAGLPETPPLPLPDKPSIAVLPFTNMSDDPKQEYFSDGITEEIITALSKTPKLFVIARNSTFTYKGKPVKVQQVGRELGVKYVLEGSVRKAEDKVRITAQLVDTQTGHHLWAERYDRDLKDIFVLQDEITMKIVTALRVRLTDGEVARMSAKRTDNLEAYLWRLQAVEQIIRMNREGLFLARQMAEKAIELDSKYAEAYYTLASTYWLEVPLGLTKDPRQSIARAMDLTQKAISLDKSYALARSLLGMIYVVRRQHDKGILECEQAISLEPNSAWAHYFLGNALRFAGRQREAIANLKEAIRLDPIPSSSFYGTLANSYCLAGQYEEAIRVGKKATLREPDNLFAHAFLAAAYSLHGRKEEAGIEAREVFRINPKFSLEHWAKTIPYKNEADRDLIIGAMRKAGLK